MKAVVKPQYVDQIPKAVSAKDRTVESLLKARVQMKNYEEVLDVLGTKFSPGIKRNNLTSPRVGTRSGP